MQKALPFKPQHFQVRASQAGACVICLTPSPCSQAVPACPQAMAKDQSYVSSDPHHISGSSMGHPRGLLHVTEARGSSSEVTGGTVSHAPMAFPWKMLGGRAESRAPALLASSESWAAHEASCTW